MTHENVDKLHGNEYEFAIACMEMNTLSELSESHAPEDADEADCKTWNLTAQEWSNSVEAARLDMIDENTEA